MSAETAVVLLAAPASSSPTALPARRRIRGKRSCPYSPTPTPRAAACGRGAAPRPRWPLRTLVVNLDRRRDRWSGIRGRLAALEASGLLTIERLSAVDGRDLEGVHAADSGGDSSSEVLRKWTTDRNARYDGRSGYRAGIELELTPGERACAMSHICAWREVLADGGEAPVLILEDDAVPRKAFARRLRSTVSAAEKADADVLYLGYIQGAPWVSEVCKGLQEAEYLWTTVAYVLWPRGARRLLERLPVDCPVDNFMAWHTSQKHVRTLAVVPELVQQEGEWDFGSDVPHSDDVVLDLPAGDGAVT